jgi:flagellar motility protein MotE (MotC chaperone)
MTYIKIPTLVFMMLAALAHSQVVLAQDVDLDQKADLLLITGTVSTPSTPKTANDYCESFHDVASEARFGWQVFKLKELQDEVAKATDKLESERQELQQWVERRDQFINRANEQLTAIYQKMKPDVAAGHISALDDETASALLLKLQPRVTSLIFNEMTAARAAQLVSLISGASKYASVSEKKNK